MTDTSLLNKSRPPVFCPGCSHERVVQALDKALIRLGVKGNQVVIVSDIGCSGLFDTFFNTHAVHGLHGRALTYATGIKLARPELKVIVTMGDGGLGIGGAHVLATCRRNIDLTLLVLNNFNYGMTGGQYSVTTPQDAKVSSGFLNQLEKPIDICQVTASAGAGWVDRTSVYEKNLVEKIEEAIRFEGFSVLDIWGICTGRYIKRNEISPKIIKKKIEKLPEWTHFLKQNKRPEYTKHYTEVANNTSSPPEPIEFETLYSPPQNKRHEIVIMGAAGQRIVTAGELLCMAGVTAGLYTTQKNDYPITVMRGHSVTEVILSPEKVDFTGIENPTVLIALAEEGVNRKKSLFKTLSPDTTIIIKKGLNIPPNNGSTIELDFDARKIRSQDLALASIAWLAKNKIAINEDMLTSALKYRFKGEVLTKALQITKTWKE